MNDQGNKITGFLLRIFNIIFLYNVLGTSYGVILGVLLISVQDLISSVLWAPFGLIKEYGFIMFGVLLLNIKPLIKDRYVDPRIEMKLKYVREMLKEGKFSDKEIRAIWRETIKDVFGDLSENKDILDDKNDSNNIVPG